MQYYQKKYGNYITYWRFGVYAKKAEIDLGLQAIFERHKAIMDKILNAPDAVVSRYSHFLDKLWGEKASIRDKIFLSLFNRIFRDVSTDSLMFWSRYIDQKLYEANFDPPLLRSKYLGILEKGSNNFAIKLFVTEVITKRTYAKKPKKELKFSPIVKNSWIDNI